MRYFPVVFIILLLLGSQGLKAQRTLNELLNKYNSGNIPYTSVEELRMSQLSDKVLILDAREPDEYEVSHIENSVHVGFNDFKISAIDTVSRTRSIVVYCSLGIRSENIARQLREAGFKYVENLYGGIFEWKNAGYPVIDDAGQETEKVHAYSKKWSVWLENAEIIY